VTLEMLTEVLGFIFICLLFSITDFCLDVSALILDKSGSKIWNEKDQNRIRAILADQGKT
jgi:hypothetical protein